MKIYLAKYEPERIGGGWSFMRNFAKAMGDDITPNYNEASIYFVSSPSMVQRDEVRKAKEDGKKVVLRLDNAVRNSRNRNTGMTRMYDIAQMADLVVYQSQWAKDYLMPFVGKDGVVIINGVDLDLYRSRESDGNKVLYSRFNRDETKNYEVARYWYSQYQRKHTDATLFIVGQFSQELRDGNFDFYMHEDYRYLGVLSPESMANLYFTCDKFLYTYFNDACSNSLIEALVSGCEIVGDEYYQETGGAKEIMEHFERYGRNYFSLDSMGEIYRGALAKL